MAEQAHLASIAANKQIQSENQESNKEKNASQEEYIKNQCEKCIKSSSTKSDEGMSVNKTEAIEKLDLLKQTINNTDMHKKIDLLMDQLHQLDSKLMLDQTQTQELISKAFQPVQAREDVANTQTAKLIAAQANPFKPDNPFAAKVVTQVSAAKSASQLSEKRDSDPPYSLPESIIL